MTDPTPERAGSATEPRELNDLIRAADAAALRAWADGPDSAEAARVFSRLPEDSRASLLSLIGPELAAELVQRLPDSLTTDAFETLEPADAARIIERMPSNEQADLIGELAEEEAGATGLRARHRSPLHPERCPALAARPRSATTR